MEVCDVCGLPKDLCVCEEIAREAQRIKLYTVKRKYGKTMTIVEGIDEKDVDLRDLSKKLKTKCACGGTTKEGKIELQGNHKAKVKEILVGMGFSREMIDIE